MKCCSCFPWSPTSGNMSLLDPTALLNRNFDIAVPSDVLSVDMEVTVFRLERAKVIAGSVFGDQVISGGTQFFREK